MQKHGSRPSKLIQAEPDITTLQLTIPHREIRLATWINASETSTNHEEWLYINSKPSDLCTPMLVKICTQVMSTYPGTQTHSLVTG